MQYFQAHNWNALLPYLDNWTKAAPNDPMPWYYMGISFKRHASLLADVSYFCRFSVRNTCAGRSRSTACATIGSGSRACVDFQDDVTARTTIATIRGIAAGSG